LIVALMMDAVWSLRSCSLHYVSAYFCQYQPSDWLRRLGFFAPVKRLLWKGRLRTAYEVLIDVCLSSEFHAEQPFKIKTYRVAPSSMDLWEIE